LKVIIKLNTIALYLGLVLVRENCRDPWVPMVKICTLKTPWKLKFSAELASLMWLQTCPLAHIAWCRI